MKKILLAALLMCSMTTTVSAQDRLNGLPSFRTGTNPYFTGLDTVGNTSSKVDTLAISGQRNYITYTCKYTHISGTMGTGPAGYIACFASGDGGLTYCSTAEWTDSLGNSSTNYKHVITGNPNTHYRFVIQSRGTVSSSYKRSVLIR